MKEQQAMSTALTRHEFVVLAMADGSNVRELCRRYGVSPKTGYKWISRYKEHGAEGLKDRPRRPHRSPKRTSELMEQMVMAVRKANPDWGGRKIRRHLQLEGHTNVPSAGTITAILKRHGIAASLREEPNERQVPSLHTPNGLWQLEWKSQLSLAAGMGWPLTILDNYSRFAIALQLCEEKGDKYLQERLTIIFHRYGLPEWILLNSYNPSAGNDNDFFTPLTAWFIRLGIQVVHNQSNQLAVPMRDEVFHHYLDKELMSGQKFTDLSGCQKRMDEWRRTYNLERPHPALSHITPASMYRTSPRIYPDTLPEIQYLPADDIRRVSSTGEVTFHDKTFYIGAAFADQLVAMRPTVREGLFDVFFCGQRIRLVNIRKEKEVEAPASRGDPDPPPRLPPVTDRIQQ